MYKASFLNFLERSVTPYHTVKCVEERLVAAGYEKLYEADKWELTPGGKYYVIRGNSSVIAFVNRGFGFMICASHSDFPAFRVKGSVLRDGYLKLDVEKYGGLINYSWFDRPLSVAGRITAKTEDGIKSTLSDIGGKTVFIPSVAIHFNRDVNESCKFNTAKDLLPLASIGGGEGVLELLAKNAGFDKSDVLTFDAYLYNSATPTVAGLKDELLLSPRLDNLSGVYASLEGFLGAENEDSTPILAIFNNEEVGSSTRQGAESSFLRDTLERLCSDAEEYKRRTASGFMLSMDNGHAKHPNSPELSDRENAPMLGEGIIIKYNSNQRYTTDSVSDAIMRYLCSEAGVKVQSYFNRADMLGGSTLGAICTTKVCIPSVDIGLAQLAMHSSCESIAIADEFDMIKVAKALYSHALSYNGECIIPKA